MRYLSGPGASDVVPAEDANHPLIFVDHRQPADPQLFHVRGRLVEVIIPPAAMDACDHYIARRRAADSKPSFVNPLQTMSRSVTMPISLSFSPIGTAPILFLCISFATSVIGVSGPTQKVRCALRL